jgi:hypothetical protein
MVSHRLEISDCIRIVRAPSEATRHASEARSLSSAIALRLAS